MDNEPQEIYVQCEEFYYDDESIVDEMPLDEFIKVIKSKFDFSDPNYKHKVVQYKCMRDGGDYHDDYEEVGNLEFITYRYETEIEAHARIEEFNRNEKERLEKEEIKREAQAKQYKEQYKTQSKEKLKEWYDKASEYYTKEEIENILKDSK